MDHAEPPLFPPVEVRALADGAPLVWLRTGSRVVMEVSLTGAAADTALLGDWADELGQVAIRGLVDTGCGATRCWITLDLAPSEVDGALRALAPVMRHPPAPRPGVDTRSGWGAALGPVWPAGRAVVLASPEDPARWLPAIEGLLTGYGSGPPTPVPAPPPGLRRDTGTGIGLAFPDTVEGDWFAGVLVGRTTARLQSELRERRGMLYSVVRAGPWWTIDTPDDTAALAIVEAEAARPVRAEEWARAAAWLRTDTLLRLDSPADLVRTVDEDVLAGRPPFTRARERLALEAPPSAPPPLAILIGGDR